MTHDLIAQTRIPTPLGTMTAAATAQGVAGLWFGGQRHHPGALDAPDVATQPHLAQLRRELDRYWQDPSMRFAVALDPRGTPFQRAVWALLRTLGPAERPSYGALAQRLGRPQAARAVGAAVGRNPIGIVVPCHRVLGRDGALTGYAGGLDRKRWLLRHEDAAAERAAA
jgi:methylated-DNA-[protein]-cysteine S-methyltransferase